MLNLNAFLLHLKHTWMQWTRLTYEIEDRPLENDILSVCGTHCALALEMVPHAKQTFIYKK